MAKHPLMPAQFFSDNRKNLLEKLSNDSMALLQAAEPMIRNSDQPHFWRQDSNFFYFTGIEQAGCSLLLNPNADGKPTEILFIPPVDPELEKWEGELLTSKKATAISGIKSVFTIDNFATVFFRAQKWKDLLYCEVNDIFPDQPLTKQHLFLKDLAVRLPGLQLKKLASLTSGLRVHKKPEEVDNIRKALSIANQGIRSVIQKIHPDMYEYEIEAELAYHYIANGCTRLGFDSIVAAGKNATTLHYTSNNTKIQDGDLVLIDTGGEFGMYSGDITRTIPANGKFSERQRVCYQAVLDVQKRFIQEIKVGMSWNELHKLNAKIQGEIYVKSGFIEKPEDYLKVAFHRIGHSLGLDVHDVGNPEWKLQAGAVITVEPGLYLPEEGIGIRIEDNILFQKDGVEVLSKAIPKEIEEIESLHLTHKN